VALANPSHPTPDFSTHWSVFEAVNRPAQAQVLGQTLKALKAHDPARAEAMVRQITDSVYPFVGTTSIALLVSKVGGNPSPAAIEFTTPSAAAQAFVAAIAELAVAVSSIRGTAASSGEVWGSTTDVELAVGLGLTADHMKRFELQALPHGLRRAGMMAVHRHLPEAPPLPPLEAAATLALNALHHIAPAKGNESRVEVLRVLLSDPERGRDARRRLVDATAGDRSSTVKLREAIVHLALVPEVSSFNATFVELQQRELAHAADGSSPAPASRPSPWMSGR
jgi:hypothetical protein